MQPIVGKRYEVITVLDCIANGTIVEVLVAGPNYSSVKLVKGWIRSDLLSERLSINNSCLKPIEDIPMNTPNEFPDYDFKVTTKGFNSHQLKAAYEWLKECAINKSLTFLNLKDNHQRKYYFLPTSLDYVQWDSVEDDDHPELPEIKLNIETKSVVTGFTVQDDKEENLKDSILRLEKSLKEDKSELNTLKNSKEKL